MASQRVAGSRSGTAPQQHRDAPVRELEMAHTGTTISSSRSRGGSESSTSVYQRVTGTPRRTKPPPEPHSEHRRSSSAPPQMRSPPPQKEHVPDFSESSAEGHEPIDHSPENSPSTPSNRVTTMAQLAETYVCSAKTTAKDRLYDLPQVLSASCCILAAH